MHQHNHMLLLQALNLHIACQKQVVKKIYSNNKDLECDFKTIFDDFFFHVIKNSAWANDNKQSVTKGGKNENIECMKYYMMNAMKILFYTHQWNENCENYTI